VVEETAVAEEDRMTEEGAEKETDLTEMEEVEVEEMTEKEESVMNLEIRVNASLETGVDLSMNGEEEEEVMGETGHLEEMVDATVEEEETAVEEEAVEAVVASEASQLILPLHQASQCHLKLIT